NWNPDGAPSSGDFTDIHFAGSTNLSPDYNYTSPDYQHFRDIIFDAGASSFTLVTTGGYSINLYGKIENNSSNDQRVKLQFIALHAADIGSNNELDPTLGKLIIDLQGGPGKIFTNGNDLNVWGNTNHTLVITA